MRMTRTSGILAGLGLFVLGAGTPAAQAPAASPQLANVKSLTCTFPVAVAATWDKETGEPNVAVRKSAVLTFKFDQIDTSESSARFVGPTAAPEHVVAQLSGWNLHFMDIRPSGSLSITTVFAQYTKEPKLKAVYTRTDYLQVSIPGFASQPDVSQRYGECEIVS